MSKIRTVMSRTHEGVTMTLTNAQVRKIRKAEHQARISGIQPDFRNHLPYDLNSINRMFFYMKPLNSHDLKTPFVGHYPAEQGVSNPALDGEIIEPIIEPSTTAVAPEAGEVADAGAASKPKKARKPAAKDAKVAKPAKAAAKPRKAARLKAIMTATI
jgi:hypothetical protein